MELLFEAVEEFLKETELMLSNSDAWRRLQTAFNQEKVKLSPPVEKAWGGQWHRARETPSYRRVR